MEYLLRFCFLWRATFYLLDRLCRLWQKTVAIFSPVQRRLAHNLKWTCDIQHSRILVFWTKIHKTPQDYSLSKEKLPYKFRFFEVAITSLYHIKANFTKIRLQVLLAFGSHIRTLQHDASWRTRAQWYFHFAKAKKYWLDNNTAPKTFILLIQYPSIL